MQSYSLKAASGFQGGVEKRTAPGSPTGFFHASSFSVASAPFQRSLLQYSQENEEPAATEESTVEGACLFLLRNSILRLAFLLCVEGLSFFLSTGSAASQNQSQSLAPGVQGEGEGGAHVQGEVESLALGGQCLAKFHALGVGQGDVNLTRCSHFDVTSEL